jgi:type I restriction enzyme, S subunit
MANRPNLSPPPPKRNVSAWHTAKIISLPADLLMHGDRRLEGETYLSGGYGIRLALEARPQGLLRLRDLARVWQPSRLKGIQVSPGFGTPFLAATQVFDLRPVPRKFLALERTDNLVERFVTPGMILVTRSGSVGRATLAHKGHENTIVSDDLLRIQPLEPGSWGWLYAYLRAPQVRAMMNSVQYGHIIKHLEVAHLGALPIPALRPALLADFEKRVKRLLAMRDEVYTLVGEAEDLFAAAIGPVVPLENPEVGFSVPSTQVLNNRGRFEASFYTPGVSAILARFAENKFVVEPLSEVTERVWWMNRFKRVFGREGTPYMSADEIFALNPTITKWVVIEQAVNADDYFVKSGWLVMARSGQIYGLNGSVALMTKMHEKLFLSDDLVRIIPNHKIRPGYLHAALMHPKLGQPLVKRYAYGTSIPHMDPEDIATFPVVRLGKTREDAIADLMERAASVRAEADELENEIAAAAEAILDRFLAGDTRDVVV